MDHSGYLLLIMMSPQLYHYYIKNWSTSPYAAISETLIIAYDPYN